MLTIIYKKSHMTAVLFDLNGSLLDLVSLYFTYVK